jgi:two-component system sensor histidine kinase DesK
MLTRVADRPASRQGPMYRCLSGKCHRKSVTFAESRSSHTRSVFSSDPHSADSRLARLTKAGVIAFSAMLPASQLALYHQDLGSHGYPPALALGAAVIALSLWHVRYGLRDERPPRAWFSLGLMVIISAAGQLLLGPAWTLVFASLAASALIVLRPPWSLFGFAAVLLAVGLLGSERAGQQSGYLVLSVAFRAVTLFVLVWVVAAITRLNAARATLSELAIAAERARIDDELHQTLAASLAEIASQAREADRLVATSASEAAGAVLEQMVANSRSTLAGVRETVASYRQSATRAELRAVSQLLELDELEAAK